MQAEGPGRTGRRLIAAGPRTPTMSRRSGLLLVCCVLLAACSPTQEEGSRQLRPHPARPAAGHRGHCEPVMAPGCLQRHIVPASQPEHHLPGRSGLPGVKSERRCTPVPKALPEARMLPDLGAGGRREALRGTLPLRTPGRGHTGPASADPGGDRNTKVRSDKLKFLFTERPRCHLPVPGAAPRRVMRSARPARLARVPRGTGGIRRPGGSRGRNSYSSRIIRE
jgi:hypothetical protein